MTSPGTKHPETVIGSLDSSPNYDNRKGYYLLFAEEKTRGTGNVGKGATLGEI